MSRTMIKTGNIVNASNVAKSISQTAYGVSEGVASVSGGTDSQIKSRYGIGGRLSGVENDVNQIANKVAAICCAVESGALQYQNTEMKLVKQVRLIKGRQAIKTKAIRRSIYEDYFKTDKKEKIADINLTKEQMKNLMDAIEKNNKAEALKVLGIAPNGQYSEEEKALIDKLWEDLCTGFKENIVNDFKNGLKEESLESGGNWIAQIVASHINMNTLLKVGPVSTNSFVILNPQVASKTASMMSGVSTGLKFGIPIIGGIVDYAAMRSEGETVNDAAVKSVAHVGIGMAGAAIGASLGSVIPGVGTVIGGVIGFIAGVVITTAGNSLFDSVYDNREEIKDAAVEAWDSASDWMSEKRKQLGEATQQVKERISNVGYTWTTDWKTLGNVLG